MNTLTILLKREYWEHKGAIFYTPAIMAAVFAGLMLIGSFSADEFVVTHNNEYTFSDHLPKLVDKFEELSEREQKQGVQVALYGTLVFFCGVMLLISLFYCLGCLYDERKDRSILFWKSMPVSDTKTVLSKFATVCFLIPISYFVVITAFQIYMMIFSTVLAWIGGSWGTMIWASSNLFGVMFNGLMALIMGMLWLSPFWAWLIFASSWAKKVAFMWAALPIIMLTIAEGWIFKTNYFIEMVAMRGANTFSIMNSNLHFTTHKEIFDIEVMRWYEVFGNSAFWIGLIVAGVFLAGAIYTRSVRNET
ncbi:MAG: ABC-2 type transport system permease protein [Polaribacter sp.]|jgi:ABC-2 type transport system permease protein